MPEMPMVRGGRSRGQGMESYGVKEEYVDGLDCQQSGSQGVNGAMQGGQRNKDPS